MKKHSKLCWILKHEQNIICHEATWQVLISAGSKMKQCFFKKSHGQQKKPQL